MSADQGKKRRLTKTQAAILRCMAQNNGRAEIYVGVRHSTYGPGFAHIFGQGLHCMLHFRWITNRGQNSKSSYVWTAEGKLAHERGWHVDAPRGHHWLEEKPEPFVESASAQTKEA